MSEPGAPPATTRKGPDQVKTFQHEMQLRTAGGLTVTDITHDVVQAVAASGIRDGICCVYSPHTTCSVRVNEWERGFLEDFAVMLRRVDEPGLIRPMEAQGGTWDAFFWVDDAEALHTELVGRGATVVYGPIVQDAYHMLEFAVRDTDGHVLGFGQPIES